MVKYFMLATRDEILQSKNKGQQLDFVKNEEESKNEKKSQRTILVFFFGTVIVSMLLGGVNVVRKKISSGESLWPVKINLGKFKSSDISVTKSDFGSINNILDSKLESWRGWTIEIKLVGEAENLYSVNPKNVDIEQKLMKVSFSETYANDTLPIGLKVKKMYKKENPKFYAVLIETPDARKIGMYFEWQDSFNDENKLTKIVSEIYWAVI